MALNPLSTQASVEARASAARVLLWTDKDDDDTPDPVTLDQGFQFAAGLILEYCNQRYGETEAGGWTLTTAPARILRISDDLCMWYFSSGNFSQNPLIETIYNAAIASLEGIRDKTVSVYGAVEGVTGTSDTDEPTNPFDDRTYFNE